MKHSTFLVALVAAALLALGGSHALTASPTPDIRGVTTAVLIATPGVVPAWTPSSPTTASYTWSAPSVNTDGSAIAPGTLSYGVFEGPAGALVRVSPPLAGQTFGMSGGPELFIPGLTYCFAVTAIENGVESAQSAQACVKIPLPTPSEPTQVQT